MAEGLWFAIEENGAENRPEIPGYEVLRLLGTGGMGQVWLARQTSLDRFVAVKVLNAGGGAASQWLDRLEREARAMARISHPHIVAVYDFVRLNDGGAAIVMEWVASGTLREKWLASGKPVRDLGAVLAVARQIASSLVAAHGAGIVHRDLKPENVLVAVDGSVKVTDFGLALPLGPDSQRLTLTGASMGTLGYMAPEQVEGKEVDARADLYSLGVILYELLTGVRPQGHFDPPGRVRRNLPSGLEKLVLDSLRTRPQKRIASATEFLARLERCGKSRTPVVAGSALALVGLAFAGVSLSIRLGSEQSSPPVPPETETTPSPEIMPSPDAPPSVDAPTPAEAEPPLPPPLAAPVGTAGLSVPEGWESRVAVKALRGEWAEESGGFRSDGSKAILRLLDSLPPEGAIVRAAFTRLDGPHSVAVFFRTPRGAGTADVSAWEQDLAGVQTFDGQDLRALAAPTVFPIENGRRYEMEVEVRPERVVLRVDGRILHEVETAGRELGVAFPWGWDALPTDDTTDTWIAIGSYESPTLFHEVEVLAIP